MSLQGHNIQEVRHIMQEVRSNIQEVRNIIPFCIIIPTVLYWLYMFDKFLSTPLRIG